MQDRSSWIFALGAGLTLAATAVATTAAAADRKAEVRSAAQLERMVAQTKDGLVVGQLPTGEGGPTVLIVRRDGPAEVELHRQMDDVFVVHAGAAAVLIGGTAAGQHELSPGEMRGGTLSGAARYEVKTGDILFIPAGLPHQVVVPRGGSFSYLAMKFPAGRGS